MDSEGPAQLVLALYAASAVAIIVRQALRCQDGLQVWLLYVIERLYCPFMFHWRANRRCPFPQTGPALIIANHRSPVDPLMIWMNHHLAGKEHKIRVMVFMTAREYLEKPGLRWLRSAMQCIPTDRDGRDVGPAREALRRLESGQLVAVFPEGRLNRGDGLLDANPGVAWLALRARVPVYPVFIHDSPQGKNMVDPFCTVSQVRVSYGDPIDLSSYFDRRKTRELLEEVTDLLMSRLAELGGIQKGDSDADDPPDVLPLARRIG